MYASEHTWPKQLKAPSPLISKTNPNPYIVDNEPEPQYAEMSDRDKQELSDDYAKEYTDSGKYDKTVSMTKPNKDYNNKSEGAKDLQRIPLSYYEDLYIKEEGKLWYVTEYPDGSVTKMQMQIDYTTGELTFVEDQGTQRIPLSYYEDFYITDEDELWYVNENPNGSVAKIQLQIDDMTGEIAIGEVFSSD